MCHAARSGWGLKAGCARPRSSGRLALHAGGLALLLDVHADGEDEGAYPDCDDKDVDEDGKGAAYADGLEKRLQLLMRITLPTAVPRMQAGMMRTI